MQSPSAAQQDSYSKLVCSHNFPVEELSGRRELSELQGSKVGRGIHTRGSKAMVAIPDSHSRATGSPSMATGSLLGAAMDLPQVYAPPHVRSHYRPMSVKPTPLASVLPAQGGTDASLSLVLHDSRYD